MKTLGVLVLAMAMACSGGPPGGKNADAGGGDASTDASGCSATLSGAVTASYPACVAVASWDGSKNTTTVSLQPEDASNVDSGPTTAIEIPGMLTTGTFQDTDANANGVVLYVDTSSASSVPQWSASVGPSAGSQGHVGSYSLTLTSVEPFASTTSVIDYDLHGTLTATLAPIAGTGATGNIDYSITF